MKRNRRQSHRVSGKPKPAPSGSGAALALPGHISDAFACASSLDSKVLVLNRLYRAIRVVPARRAFTLLFNDVAEVIHVDNGQYNNFDFKSWAEIGALYHEYEHNQHEWIRTVSSELAVPRVIRLFGYDRLPRQQVKLNRRNLFARDRNHCQYCGHHYPSSELSIDHVKPRAQGGGDTWTNLVCACIRCNARKGGRTPKQAHMKLKRPPVQPKRNPAIAIRLGHEKYESWKAFLDEAYWSVELG